MAHDPDTVLRDQGQPIRSLSPWRITLIYLVVGALWILLSDRVLSALTDDPALLTRVSTYKGWFYVLATAGLLYTLIRRSDQVLERRVEERTRQLSTLLAVSRDLASTPDLESLLDMILEQLKVVVDYSGAAILDLDEGELVVRAYRGPVAPDIARGLRIPALHAHHRQVIDSRTPVIIADTKSDGPLADSFRELSSSILEPYFGYAASWMGAPLISKGRVIGLLILHHTEPYFYSHKDTELVTAFTNQVAVAINSARLHQQAEQLAVVQERQRLARELHDSVTQALYSVTLYAEAARMAVAAGKQEVASEHLKELHKMAREAMLDMRMLIFELHPPLLEQEGLVAALEARLASVESRAGLQAEVQVEGERSLALTVEEELFWIALEAFNNIIKHAQAQQVLVCLRFDEESVCLEICDDGCGFDQSEAGQGGGLGLRGMQERAARIHGQLEVESAPGSGTVVRVTAQAG